MYPNLGDFGRPNSSSQPSSSQNQAQPRWPPPQLTGPAQNGPSSSHMPLQHSNSGGAQNFPTLRVHIAEQYRTLPPVMVNSGLEEIPRSSFTYDFSYEQQLMRSLQSSLQSSAPEGQRLDPSQAAVDRFTQLGYSRPDVCLALAAVGDAESAGDDKVVEFCKNYKELKSMGFDSTSVVGALVLHKCDLQAATDACLTAQH